MEPTRYIKLDLIAIERDFTDVWIKYRNTHRIDPMPGTEVDLTKLHSNQSVISGDGKSFYFILTKL